MTESSIFFAVAAAILVSAAKVVSSRDLVHAVLWLGVVLVLTAGMFLLLSAPFLAGIQLLLYTGGVITLMLFGVMLTRRHREIGVEVDSSRRLPGALGALALFGAMACAIFRTELPAWPASEPIPAVEIGRAFLTDHLIAFEALSVLLLAAMIGAIVLGRQRDFGDEPETVYRRSGRP
ncbi:MAG: NADH-quinone oxidoreductase subunit J [Deltaproteobacteria bacterium]|jgi:NADH-quinone oxidoreductase subunit J|nr:NADH-quinone oxidoreductase subunit J [Deltaproteobacteria bacterium]